MAAARATQQVRFYFFADPFKRFKVNVVWAHQSKSAVRPHVSQYAYAESLNPL
jgi:hypothetical protein